MLEYRANIDYHVENKEDSIDVLLSQLANDLQVEEAIIYQEIRKKVQQQIKLEQLAITRIAPDLLQIRKNDKVKRGRRLQLVLHLLSNPYCSYQQLGRQCGYTRQRAHYILTQLADKYYWIDNLLTIRGR